MKKLHFNIRLTEAGKRAAAGIAAGAVVLALLVFFLLFSVRQVEVVGSTKYTDSEIKEYAMKSPLTSNSLLAVLFKSHMEAENIPFVESFDLERLDRHTIRIHVNEKKIVGYVVQGTDKLYFDKDGKVVEEESMGEEEIQVMENQTEELEVLRQQAEQEEALKRAQEAEEELSGEHKDEDKDDEDSQGQIPMVEEAQTLKAEETAAGNESATEFHAAVTDVPRVVGLDTGTVQLGKKIKVKESSVFNTILGITRMVEKYGILPEVVYFDSGFRITLVYQEGNIHCQLGKDTLLEEKITRVAAILPKLENETGILHLEDYTAETTNIIFSKESLYSLKKVIAEAEGTTETSAAPEAEGSTGTGGTEGSTEAGAAGGTDGTADPGTTGETDGTTGLSGPQEQEGAADSGDTQDSDQTDPSDQTQQGEETTPPDGIGGGTTNLLQGGNRGGSGN